MGKKIAITGVNSYFARTVLPILENDPEVEEIIGIDVRPFHGGYKKVRFYKEDIRSGKLFEILEGVDTVYHLAYIVGEIHDKEKTRDININGSKNVFQAAAKNHVRKVIYTSSMTAYGSHPDTPLGLTEEHPLRGNKDSYYASSKVEVENFVRKFFSAHPEIILTVIRAGLLAGPHMNNFFSKLWSMKISSLPMGRNAHNQLIHEKDLGRALYLACEKDIPGVYNVAADDAVATKWMFQKAGVIIIPMPALLLKLILNIAFKLRLMPASQGWASLSEYTIFGNCDKFKEATGWQPAYSSEETFYSYLEGRKRDAKDTAIQSFLSWLYKRGDLMRPNLKILDINFMLGKNPVTRKLHPWMDPKKNSMSYLPINKSLEEQGNTVLPPQVLFDFIDQASHHVIMDTCGCRLANRCEHFTHEVGCLFMGETALKMPHGVSRRVTRDEARAHAEKAINLGLVPMTGKVRVDNFIFLTPDKQKLLSVCFCCHCCCMMGYLRHIPAPHLDGVMQPIEGLKIEVTDDCRGCGTCVEYCRFDAITIENGKAVHSDMCRGCGRCERYCPNGAIRITLENPEFVDQAKKRIANYTRI